MTASGLRRFETELWRFIDSIKSESFMNEEFTEKEDCDKWRARMEAKAKRWKSPTIKREVDAILEAIDLKYLQCKDSKFFKM